MRLLVLGGTHHVGRAAGCKRHDETQRLGRIGCGGFFCGSTHITCGETAFIGGWMVYATKDEVDELSEHVVQWLRDRRKPEDQREPDTPLVYVTYRALPQTPTAES